MRVSFKFLHTLRFLAVLALGLPGLAAADAKIRLSYEGKTQEIDVAELAKLPAAEAVVTEHGTQHHYHGVAARDVLALVGAPFDKQMHGSALALIVKVHGADGYVVAFALAEFDAAHREQTILLADQQDGTALAAHAGPWRLVCPGDKRPARGVRQVTWLEIISVGTDRPDHPHS